MSLKIMCQITSTHGYKDTQTEGKLPIKSKHLDLLSGLELLGAGRIALPFDYYTIVENIA